MAELVAEIAELVNRLENFEKRVGFHKKEISRLKTQIEGEARSRLEGQLNLADNLNELKEKVEKLEKAIDLEGVKFEEKTDTDWEKIWESIEEHRLVQDNPFEVVPSYEFRHLYNRAPQRFKDEDIDREELVIPEEGEEDLVVTFDNGNAPKTQDMYRDAIILGIRQRRSGRFLVINFKGKNGRHTISMCVDNVIETEWLDADGESGSVCE